MTNINMTDQEILVLHAAAGYKPDEKNRFGMFYTIVPRGYQGRYDLYSKYRLQAKSVFRRSRAGFL